MREQLTIKGVTDLARLDTRLNYLRGSVMGLPK